MLNYGDSKIVMWNYDQYIQSDFTLDSSEYNLNFAFALVPLGIPDGDEDPAEIPPEYGELNVWELKWDFTIETE